MILDGSRNVTLLSLLRLSQRVRHQLAVRDEATPAALGLQFVAICGAAATVYLATTVVACGSNCGVFSGVL